MANASRHAGLRHVGETACAAGYWEAWGIGCSEGRGLEADTEDRVADTDMEGGRWPEVGWAMCAGTARRLLPPL